MGAAWEWLKDEKNQRTLALIGAAIAGTVTVLVQTGVIGKKEEPKAEVKPAGAAAAAPAPAAATPPPIIQEAKGGDGAKVSNIVIGNIQGSNGK